MSSNQSGMKKKAMRHLLLSAGVLALCSCTTTATTSVNTTDTVDTQMGADTGTTLYTRLGGNSGIAAFVNAAVTNVLKDPELAAFFSATGTTGHPTRAQIEECFTNLVGSASGGTEKYPTKTKDGFQCRDMKTAHTGLKIPASSFDKFVASIAATATSAGVAKDDIATIGTVLNGTKPDIVGQ